MNERIQELWKRAGGHYNRGNQHTWPEYTIDDPEKFAELIVRECVEICNQAILHNEDMLPKFNKPSEMYEKLVTHGAILQAEKLIDGITQYFGVNDE
jgi:hypothetical protein